MALLPEDKAMVIAFSGACILILVFFFLSIKPYNNPIPETFFEIPIIKEPNVNKEITKQSSTNSLKSHQLNNQLAKELQKKDPIRTAIEQKRKQSVKELLAKNEETLNDQKTTRQINKQNDTSKELVQPKASKIQNTTISYSLNDRIALKIPNPVYTCSASGIIVIDITVLNNGNISRVKLNPSMSQSNNGCLIDQALKYAKKAVFNTSQHPKQLGTITFYFQN